MNQQGQRQAEQEGQLRRLRAEVEGAVQGVGFRYFVQRKASMLGLRGYVCNTERGSVEVVAEGPESVLRQLETLLHQGPGAAEVECVQSSWEEPRRTFASFTIKM